MEVVGVKMLRRMGEALYDSADPTQVLHLGSHQEITKLNGDYQLRLALPFVEKSEISYYEGLF